MTRERYMIPGGLTAAQVARLSPEVRAARAAYIGETAAELDSLFSVGVRELPMNHPDKDTWGMSRRELEYAQSESLEAMTERGFQFDLDGTVYAPEIDA